MSKTRLVSALLAPALLAAPLHAAETEEEGAHVREIEALDQATLDKAEVLFFEGLSHYRGGRYEDAAVRFQEAYVLTRHRDLLFNIARSRERLGDREAAVQWYRAYLATKPADETAVIHRIRQLGGDPTPKAIVKPTAEKVPQQTEPEVVERGAGPWPWVALGVGVVAAGLGTTFGVLALDDASAAREAERRSKAADLKDSAETNALIADISFGLSAAALGTAVVLWWLADNEATTDGSIQFGATGTGAAVGWTGRF